MTTTRQEVALDWVEQWQAFCAGKHAPLLKELDAPHGRVRIHGRKGDRHGCAATFVRAPDGVVVPLGTGDYPSCADACLGALSGEDAVWDSAKFPPPSVIARSVRRFFTPVDGRTVVGALEIFGGVVLLGAHHGVWSFLFHDGRRSEWLGPKSRTFDLDAWLRDHPAPAVPAPAVPVPAVPAPPTPPAAPPSSPTATTTPTPGTPPAVSPPEPPATPASTPPPTTPSPPAAPTPATPAGEPSTPPPAPAERRRQAQAAQKDAELREQQRQVAQKDAELRDQQRRVVVGPAQDVEDGPSDSDTVRACLRRLPDRAPAGQPQLVVEWFATMVIAVGEAGYFGNVCGRKADIAATLSRILGVPVCPRMLGLALTILQRMGCCLVDLANKKWWTVKLSGLGDRTSALHQALLAETGTGFQLQPVKVSFPGRRPVRWEVPRKAGTGEVTRPGASATGDTGTQQGRAPVTEAAEPDPSPTVGSREAAPATDPAAGVGEGDLRHRLTVAQGMVKLARQRHEEDRVAWDRARAELDRRVAASEGRAQGTEAKLGLLRDQHDTLLTKLTTIEQTAERTIAALVDKLERATAALEAATEHQEVERHQRAVEVDRHAGEVVRLTRDAEELRQRELDLTAERDRLAAETDGLARLADEQHWRELDLMAERDRHAAEAARLVRPAEERDLPALRIAGRDRPTAPADETGPGLRSVASVVVTCVAWTVAALTFTAVRQVSARPSPTHGTAARASGVGDSGGCDVRPVPARFPWIGPADSTRDLAAQGPRGPPARRG